MKKFILFFLASATIFTTAFSQNGSKPKEDVIIKTNGDELRGK